MIAGLFAALCLVAVARPSLQSSYFVWDRSKAISVPQVVTGKSVSTADMPAIAGAMTRSHAELRYAAFAFSTPDRPTDEDSLNIQISIESGKVGFDWVLLAPRNIEDRRKFTSFAREHGYEPVLRKLNGVSYLRIDTADAAELAAMVVTKMYNLPGSEPLTLYHEGFDWPRT